MRFRARRKWKRPPDAIGADIVASFGVSAHIRVRVVARREPHLHSTRLSFLEKTVKDVTIFLQVVICEAIGGEAGGILNNVIPSVCSIECIIRIWDTKVQNPTYLDALDPGTTLRILHHSSRSRVRVWNLLESCAD